MMTEEDRHQLRAAAENLLSGSIQSQRSGSYIHRSISSINREYIIREDLIAGSRNNGRMSNVRRFFCLLITFDLLFTCLMWLICTTIAGENISTAFVQQVLHYRIQTSMFDVVMAGVCRFIILLLFYAFLHVDHWFVVAFSTASTSAFIGAKAYFFSWDSVQQPGFEAILIMTSFVLAWGEAWYLDCRVVPQEIQARNWWNAPLMDSLDNERAPLLRNTYNSSPNRAPENMGNFFTPMDSPTHSDNEESTPKTQTTAATDDNFFNLFENLPRLSNNKIDEFKEKVKLMVNQSHELLISHKWEKLNTTPGGDVVSIMSSNYGKILKIEGIVAAPAVELVNRLYDDVEDVPTWNKDVSFVKKFQTIGENTDIIYQSTKTYGAGLIGPRDFVTLRHRIRCGKYYMTSGISVHIDIPHRKNHTRGENGIVCFATEKILDGLDSNNENKCRVTWILHANLNGWLPQRVIDKSLASMLEKMMSSIRFYVHQRTDSSG